MSADTIGVPYAYNVEGEDGKWYRECPECHAFFLEGWDATTEKETTYHYADHYVSEHES